MSKERDSMSQERWTYIKSLKPNPGKYFFVSKTFKRNPVQNAMIYIVDKVAQYKKPKPKAI